MRPALLALFVLTGCSAITDFERFRSANPDVSTVLGVEDFEYLGAIKVPLVATFSPTGLALRIVDGQRRFLLVGDTVAGNPVLETDVPAPELDLLRVRRAMVLRDWGSDVYQGRRSANGTAIQTFDLEWLDERLYWTYAATYDVTGAPNPSLGLTDVLGSASGPWSTALHYTLTHRYVTTVPTSFAPAAKMGPLLGVGGGPYGPSLIAVQAPTETTRTDQDLSSTPYVLYNELDRAIRPPTYELAPDYVDDQPHRDGMGTFTSLDAVHSAVWIDLPDKRGVVFFTSLAEGLVWKGSPVHGAITDPCNSGDARHAELRVPRWSIYDPLRLSPAAGVEPSAVREHTGFKPRELPMASQMSWGCSGEAGGAVFDAEERILYVAYLGAEQVGVSVLPMVYAFRVRVDPAQGGGP